MSIDLDSIFLTVPTARRTPKQPPKRPTEVVDEEYWWPYLTKDIRYEIDPNTHLKYHPGRHLMACRLAWNRSIVHCQNDEHALRVMLKRLGKEPKT